MSVYPIRLHRWEYELMPFIAEDEARGRRFRYRDILLSLPDNHRNVMVAWARKIADNVPGLGRAEDVTLSTVIWEIIEQALLKHIEEQLRDAGEGP